VKDGWRRAEGKRGKIPSCGFSPFSFGLYSDLESDAKCLFNSFDGDHLDGIPGTAIQKRSVRPFAGALFAPDAKRGVNFDAAKGRMVLVFNPVHAVLDGTIWHARRRARTSSAAFSNHSKLSGLFLARGVNALGLRIGLDDFAGRYEVMSQMVLPSSRVLSFLQTG
jgi:hypothetical protein